MSEKEMKNVMKQREVKANVMSGLLGLITKSTTATELTIIAKNLYKFVDDGAIDTYDVNFLLKIIIRRKQTLGL